MDSRPAFRNASTQRSEFFAKLKPWCVDISKLSMREGGVTAAGSQLITLTDKLYHVLETQVNYDATVFDAKLAEYVFFPLSYIFRQRDDCPARLIENSIKCLRILIQYGWKAALSKDLAQQLLILLTFIVGGAPNKPEKVDLPEETQAEGYRALAALIQASGRASDPSPLTEAKVMPSLGHAVSVILDGVTSARTSDVEIAALDCVQAVFTSLTDREALSSFLPGTVSTLTKLLSPPLSIKAPRRILARGLQVLKTVLVKLLGDVYTRNIQRASNSAQDSSKTPMSGLTPAWLKATASQVKLALVNVLKLRYHESEVVTDAVEELCIALLDECHISMADSASILVESAIVASRSGTSSKNSEQPFSGISGTAQELTLGTTLVDLATIYPEIGDTVVSTLYTWTQSLARMMQTNDETPKLRAIQNLVKGARVIQGLDLESWTLQEAMSTALRDSIVTLARGGQHAKVVDEMDVDEALSGKLISTRPDTQLQSYEPVILNQESQRKTRTELLALLNQIGSQSLQSKLASDMMEFVLEADGLDQVASYWLAFNLLKAALGKTEELDSFLDLSSLTRTGEDQEGLFNELYSFSVSTLSGHSINADVDWRLEAISLEIIAFGASRLRESFRPELIDVLYPVTTMLGSQNPQLRHHAIITLNCIAESCGYGSVSDLIIDNADYMVNSVSLRLNTFTITPASVRVLAMMIKLTGARLVPYLDDVVASIFAALENHHGYPSFVESLFSVLSEIVEQGSKSSTLLLEGSKPAQGHQKQIARGVSLAEIGDMLETRAKKRRDRDSEDAKLQDSSQGHPRKPWKSEAKSLLDDHDKRNQPRDEEEGGDASTSQEVEKADVPKTPTYNILTRITTLTQHYLTSPTPTLRKSLLDLLATVAPALAPDEVSYLPIINSVWPVVINRLNDSEPYVVIAACKALAALCHSSGDFLSTRIKTEWWDRLGKWCRRAKAEATAGNSNSRGARGAAGKNLSHRLPPVVSGRNDRSSFHNSSTADEGILIPIRSADGSSGSDGTLSSSSLLLSKAKSTTTGGLGRFSQASQVWEAAASLLTAVVSYVRIDDDIFAQVLDLLADRLGTHDEVRRALEAINADAVWLVRYRRGDVGEKGVLPAAEPVLEGVSFVKLRRAVR